MRSFRILAVLVICEVLVCVPASYAAVIENITGNLLSTDFYYGNGHYFQTNYTGTSFPAFVDGLLFSDADGVTYYVDNLLTGGTFSMGPSALVQDQTPSGGLAKGLFASGATLTLNGDLYADDWSTVVANGDLIVAEITTQWTLSELPSPPDVANTFDGRAFFHITGGALSNSSLNTAGLVLGDFYLDFLFQPTTPAVTDFSTLLGNNTYSCLHPSIQGGAIPEPASIILLGIGGMALLRRRK
jgi:hypothetical protein